MKKVLLAFLMLSACSTVDIKSKPVDFKAATVPDPQPMELTNVTWKVYNIQDLKTLYDNMTTEQKKTFVIYTLDATNFQDLDANIQEMYRFILEEQQTTNFYKTLQQKNNGSSLDTNKKEK